MLSSYHPSEHIVCVCSVSQQMNKVGLAIVENVIEFESENTVLHEKLKQVPTEKVFETLKIGRKSLKPCFGQEKRFQTTPKAAQKISSWNRLGKQISTFLKEEFQVDYNLSFVLLGSLAGMCDVCVYVSY